MGKGYLYTREVWAIILPWADFTTFAKLGLIMINLQILKERETHNHEKEGKKFDGIMVYFWWNIYLEGMESKNFPANIFTTSATSISN